jgi:hypothetical protein
MVQAQCTGFPMHDETLQVELILSAPLETSTETHAYCILTIEGEFAKA